MAGKLAIEYPIKEKSFMHDKLFLKINNVITGPFERPQLLQMLKSGQMQLETPASYDKKHWITLQKALKLSMMTVA